MLNFVGGKIIWYDNMIATIAQYFSLLKALANVKYTILIDKKYVCS
jgi:hypothetical protein